jgi:hypothetical protein
MKQNNGPFSPVFESHNKPEVTHTARAGEYSDWVTGGIPFFTKK